MIKLTNINKYYNSGAEKFHALKDINIVFPDKGLVTIVGKSGSGKSTLLNIIGGIDNYDSGELLIDNVNTKDFSKKDYNSYRNTYIGFIFQEFNVVKNLTVYENISLSLRLKNENLKDNDELISKTIESVGLKGKENRKMNQLSGGERQRVAIARAIVKNPKVIIADEPTGNLDKKNRDVVMDILKEISKDKLVIIVTHDKSLSQKYSIDEITLKDGAVINNTLDKKEQVIESDINLDPIQPSYKTSIFLSFKSLKQNLLRFIFIILFFTISLVFANTTINLYFSNATEEYVNFQKDYNNSYIKLSQEQSFYNQNVKSGLFQIDTLGYNELINSFSKENTEENNYTYKVYKTFKNEIPIDWNFTGRLDYIYTDTIENIIIIEDFSEFSKDYEIVYVNNTISSKVKCYISDFVAYSLLACDYFDDYVDLDEEEISIEQVAEYLTNRTITSDQFNYPIQIEGIVVTNYNEFIDVDLDDPNYYASFTDNLIFYNSLFFQIGNYVGSTNANEFVSTNNLNYVYDDLIFSALNKEGIVNDVLMTSYNDSLTLLKGKKPEKKLEESDLEQIAISTALLELITGMNADQIEINMNSENGDIALINPETGTAATFAFYGFSRVITSFSCQVVGIIESEEPTVYFCNPDENTMYYNYLKLSMSDYDSGSKNFGGYLTIAISDDINSNISLYQALRDNNLSIDNLSYIKLQVVSEFINDNLILFLGIFFALCMFSILMIFNFVVTSIKNSTKDIGIYMSLGMNGLKIAFIYIFQILLVSTIAFIVSSVGAIVFLRLLDTSLSNNASDIINLTYNLNLAPIDFKTFGITRLGIVTSLAIAFIVPFVSVVIPLVNLSRKKPIDVLKIS